MAYSNFSNTLTTLLNDCVNLAAGIKEREKIFPFWTSSVEEYLKGFSQINNAPQDKRATFVNLYKIQVRECLLEPLRNYFTEEVVTYNKQNNDFKIKDKTIIAKSDIVITHEKINKSFPISEVFKSFYSLTDVTSLVKPETLSFYKGIGLKIWLGVFFLVRYATDNDDDIPIMNKNSELISRYFQDKLNESKPASTHPLAQIASGLGLSMNDPKSILAEGLKYARENFGLEEIVNPMVDKLSEETGFDLSAIKNAIKDPGGIDSIQEKIKDLSSDPEKIKKLYEQNKDKIVNAIENMKQTMKQEPDSIDDDEE